MISKKKGEDKQKTKALQQQKIFPVFIQFHYTLMTDMECSTCSLAFYNKNHKLMKPIRNTKIA